MTIDQGPDTRLAHFTGAAQASVVEPLDDPFARPVVERVVMRPDGLRRHAAGV